MTTDNATPRPWQVWTVHTSGTTFVLAGQDVDRKARQARELCELRDPQAIANASLIVRAVNSYDSHLALVEAARALVYHDDAADRRDGLESCLELERLREALAAVEAAEKGE